MSTAENKELVQRVYGEIINGGEVERAGELIDEDYVDHQGFPGVPPGLDGFKALVSAFRTAFPDITYTIDDIVAEGDRVVTRVHIRGTHQAEFLGVAATGAHIEIPAIDVMRLEGGKVVEHWGVTDVMMLMEQFGVFKDAYES
jgi:steroid delta-isomerase-like uncharacterized protein